LSDNKPAVMIVDDERININLLNQLLRDEYKVMVATSGEQALRAIPEKLPDLILLDVMMTGMDGFDVCRRLKNDEATQNIPIIFITAINSAEEETLGFELGAVDFISKPFNSSVVCARLRTHIRLKQKSDLLEKLVALDGLTNIPNRRAFDEMLEREWAINKRTGLPISAIMIDVDKFKEYNDFYGHSAGDVCLIKVAQALTDSLLRPGDYLARYGGEEFAAILGNTDIAGALTIGERFREAIEEMQLPHERSSSSDFVTVSVGVASITPTSNSTPEALFNKADVMLYQAKQAGRNRVEGQALT